MSDVETENTFRALKDEPLLVSSWLCRWGWHRWTEWSEVYIPTNGKYNLQHSHCAACNKIRAHNLKDQDGNRI